MSDSEKQTILSHLKELRKRVIRSVIAILITTVIAFYFAPQIFEILKAPAGDIDLIFIEMTEMIGTYMKVSLAGGIMLAMPYLIYHAIMFVSPALTRKEKRYVYFILPWIVLMFAAGVAFAYFILVPPATKFLLSWGADIASPQIKIGNYIALVTRLLIAIGLIFEMPVLTTLLARLGILTSKWLASKRKMAVIFAFVIAAIITPTFDPVNQTLVAAPLIVLYEMSIWLAKLVQRKQPRTATPAPTSASQE